MIPASLRRVALALTIAVGCRATLKAEDRTADWTIQNHTKAVSVLSLEQTSAFGKGGAFELNLQNVSGRPITEVYFRVRKLIVPHIFQPPLKPGESGACKFAMSSYEPVLQIKGVLFGDEKAGFDGDARAMQWLRFSQLGEVLERARIEEVLRALSPAHLDDASIRAVIESECNPKRAGWTGLDDFEKIVAASPEVPLKRAAQEVQGKEEAGDLLNGVSGARGSCQWHLLQALKVPESERAKKIEGLISPSVRETPRWKVIEHDMGVSN